MGRTIAMFVAVALSACGSRERGPERSKGSPELAGPAERADAPARLTVADFAPHFAGGPAAPGARALARGASSEARDLLLAALQGNAVDSAADRGRLRLLVAECDARIGRDRDAAAGFEHGAAELPLLADYALARAAALAERAGEPERALASAARVASSSPFAPRAHLAAARAAMSLEQPERARADLEPILDRVDGDAWAEARYLLARAHEASGREANAAGLARTLVYRAPLSPWVEEARAMAARLGAGGPASVGELLARGQIHFDAMRNQEAEADFDAALRAPEIDPAGRCVALFHRAQSVFKQRDYRRAAPLFAPARTACVEAGDTDLAVKSAYQWGRSLDRARRYRAAATAYALVEQNPENSYADDARLRRAEVHAAAGEAKRARDLLATIPERYPRGDMRAEALWRLARDAFDRGDHAEVVRRLEQTLVVAPRALDWWSEGRAEYWLGRSLAQLGRTDEAGAAYERGVRAYPLSYYALQGLARLRDGDPARYRRLVGEIRRDAPGSIAPDALELAPLPELLQEGVARARELIRLGLSEPAVVELAALGLGVPEGKEPVTDAAERRRLWTIALLYDRAGARDRSHWIARWHAVEYRREWPSARSWARWRIAYPDAYRWLIDRAARRHGYPAALQMAIVREESGFDPQRESYANAVGLTQMIFPTARRFAKGTGIEVSRAALRDPETNVIIGSRFLAFLWRHFAGLPGLAIPAYNAGEARVRSWLSKVKPQRLDRWIEAIPGDQARRYTKRVLGSYFAYSFLWNRDLPLLPGDIPLDRLLRRGR